MVVDSRKEYKKNIKPCLFGGAYMNWLQRHLNWTFVLVGWGGGFIAAVIGGIVVGASDPYANVSVAGNVGELAFFIVLIIVGGLVIYQKGRSLWWILLIGWFSPLWLDNRRVYRASIYNLQSPQTSQLPIYSSPAPSMPISGNYAPDVHFCSNCGSHLERSIIYCPKCGKQLKSNLTRA